MAGLAYVLVSHPFEIPSILMQTDVPIVASTYVRDTINVMKPSIRLDIKNSAISAIEVCKKGLRGMIMMMIIMMMISMIIIMMMMLMKILIVMMMMIMIMMMMMMIMMMMFTYIMNLKPSFINCC
jgi:hypothetical protein